MAISQAVCNSFKTEVMLKVHDLDTDTLKIALYTSAATLDASTTAYSATNEVSGAGYTATGRTLAGVTVTLDGSTAIVDFTDPAWAGASFTARGALIYNSTAANRAIAVLDFGEDKTATGTTFTVVLPAPVAASAIVRLG